MYISLSWLNPFGPAARAPVADGGNQTQTRIHDSSWPQDTPTRPLARTNAQARGPERGRATPMVKAHPAESFQWPG